MRIALDGPAGAGKSTLAEKLARAIDGYRLNTGALYRAVAAYALARRLPLDQDETLGDLASCICVGRSGEGANTVLTFDGREEGPWLREPRVGDAASRVSALPSVRAALLDVQRELAARGTTVVEGRDIGSCVLPNAELKVYVTADPKVRALRRLKQEKRPESDLEVVLAEIIERDQRDMSRTVAPLVQPPDARVLDTSALTEDAALQQLVEWVEEVRLG